MSRFAPAAKVPTNAVAMARRLSAHWPGLERTQKATTFCAAEVKSSELVQIVPDNECHPQKIFARLSAWL